MTTWPAERRRHVRLPLRLPVRFRKINGTPSITSHTENISSDGFFCISPEGFALGDCVRADVSLPDNGTAQNGAVIHCQVRVVRTEAPGPGSGFGLGCRIENFTFAADERLDDANHVLAAGVC